MKNVTSRDAAPPDPNGYERRPQRTTELLDAIFHTTGECALESRSGGDAEERTVQVQNGSRR
jgi:hypothetical protein